MKYLVIYEELAGGWTAYSPDLPGLKAAGKVLEDVKKLIRATMEPYLGNTGWQNDPTVTYPEAIEYVPVDCNA